MTTASRRLAWLTSIALMVSLSASAVFAQSAPNIPAQTVPEGGPAALTQPSLRSEAPPVSPEKLLSTCPFAGQGLSVTPTAVTVRNATVVTPEQINAAISDVLGQSQDLSVVCTIRDRVAELYASKGYRLSRIELPAQRISGGAIELEAIEGKVSALTVMNAERAGPSAALVEAYLQKVVTGAPLYWPDLERAILLARDVPGISTDIKLRRSSAGPGTVELVVDFAQRQTFEGLVSVQDLGAQDFGSQAAILRLDANALTPFGEKSSLVVFSALNGAQYVVQWLEEARIGSSGLVANADISVSKSEPGGALSILGVEGEATIARVGLRYPIERTRQRSIHVQAGFEYVDQENKLSIFSGLGGGADILSDDKLRVLTLGGDIRWRPDAPDAPDGQPLSGLDVRGALSLRKGLSGLGASEKGSLTSSRFEGDPEFLSIRAEGAGRWTFGGRPAGGLDPGGPWVEARVSAQWADTALLAYEEYQVGNYTIGRGFDPGSASGDTAYGGQIEAGWPILKGIFGTNFLGQLTYAEPYVFFDAAHVENKDSFGYASEIASVGLGLRLRLPWALLLDFAVAQPLTEPFPGAKKPGTRFLGTITRPFTLPFR